MGVYLRKKANPETVFVFILDIGRRHADEVVARVVSASTMSWIMSAQSTVPRSVQCLYHSLNGPIESLHHGRRSFALTGKVLDIVAFHQSLEVRVE